MSSIENKDINYLVVGDFTGKIMIYDCVNFQILW